MNVLILHPDLEDAGGVAGYYKKLHGKFSLPVSRLIIGARPGEAGYSRKTFRLLRDLQRFVHTLVSKQVDIVHVNPSLDPKSLLRDGLFILVAKLLHKKTLVFFRGWHADCEDHIQKRWRPLFRSVFGRADAFIVLSEAFRRRLTSWIGDKPIYLEFAILDDDALRTFDPHHAIQRRMGSAPRRILFISRLIKEKGLYEVIDAAGEVGRTFSDVELVIAGDGPERASAQRYAAAAGYTNIRFIGYIRGHAKAKVLQEAWLLCFPTYGEGMPNTVIECMGFGLPVITRPVGGLADFFCDGVHGYATESKDPRVFASRIRDLLDNAVEYHEMAWNNYRFAQDHFRAAQAAARLEEIYRRMCDGRRKATKEWIDGFDATAGTETSILKPM